MNLRDRNEFTDAWHARHPSGGEAFRNRPCKYWPWSTSPRREVEGPILSDYEMKSRGWVIVDD